LLIAEMRICSLANWFAKHMVDLHVCCVLLLLLLLQVWC
jgi:hypothetical protein